MVQPELRVPVREPLAAAAAEAAPADLHPGRGQHRDDEVLRRAPLHVHVRLRAGLVVRRWFDGYRQAAADLGYAPEPEKIAFSVPVYVADTDERAHREARPAVDWLFRKGLKQPGELQPLPGTCRSPRCAAC